MRGLEEGFTIAPDVGGRILDDDPDNIDRGSLGPTNRRTKEGEKGKK
jgi:hypothetical protein